MMDSYWEERLNDPADRRAVIRGVLYILGEERGPATWRGFGGKKFTICFTDGRVVDTTNLNYCGQVPESYRDRLPDNARFV